MNLKQILISILLLLLGGGGVYMADQLGSQDSSYVTSITQATTSVSVGVRSIYHKQPTTTDPSTGGGDLPWIFSTTTYQGTPDQIPNYMDNQGFEYCIESANVGHAIRFWLNSNTSTDKKIGLGNDSSGILLTAGNCWDSREFGIIYGGPVYAIASTTTSTVRYIIFK